MSEENAKLSQNENQFETDQETEEKVKSRAVVKYSAPKPATFAKLQCNTDLNLPPSNWLSSSADSYGLQRVISHQKEFSSFRMAHMFPDCVGEVDVVSDAENIKNLLKIPYSKSHVSMMVHRVGNTLLLDDFDIYKHLLKSQETDWNWLRKFFFENVDRETYEEDRHSYIKNRTQKALKQRSLMSKFLYYSLASGEDTEEGQDEASARHLNPYPLQPATIQTPPLPDPSPSEECPDPHPFEFNRNVVWTFEDIEMLLGTDMPIFGGGTHPCISLRLREMNKPISVLTGIDYWLDNLMSNVPEVVMCYHLNGLVQKYSLVKTEDLPRDSKFSPKLIRDVAQCILSFLKSNATKAGHTYWLFKGKDELVVKLYDLTSLCSEEDFQKGQNPFTIPVAMLMYRLARKIKNSPDTDRRPQSGTVRMLLKNTVKLLPEEKYPEIVTSSHYMLADIYIPAELNPENPNFEQFDSEDDDSSVYDDDNEDLATAISVLDLEKDLEKQSEVDKFRNQYKPPPIVGSLEERCIQSISHIAAGLHCLQFFSEKDGYGKNKSSEEEIPMAKPSEPIPMPYAKLNDEETGDKPVETEPLSKSSKRNKKKEKKKRGKEQEQKMALLPKDPAEAARPNKWPTFDPDSISWKEHLKILLWEKAVLVYSTLAEHHIGQGRYGECLRVVGILARCQLALNRTQTHSEGNAGALKISCLLGRAGDACLMIVKHWKHVEVYKAQLHSHRDEDASLLKKLEQDERFYGVNLGDSEIKVVFIHDIRTIEQLLTKTVACYTAANKVSPADDSISRRLANSLNELGGYYHSSAKGATSAQDIIDACLKSESYFNRSLQIFEQMNDEPNIALLSANIGHLHRMLAFVHAPEERSCLTPIERKHYNKAVQLYKRSLRVIADRRNSPEIWDWITWDLSCILHTVACIMYNNPPSDVSKAEAAKLVLEDLQMALDHCILDESTTKYFLYQYRAATLHFKIATLHHSHIFDSPSLSDARRAILLAQIHYEKSVKLFLQAGDAMDYLTGQMQRIHLTEFSIDNTTASTTKLKHLQTCLDQFLEMDEMLQLILDKKAEVSEEKTDYATTVEGKSYKTLYSLLKLIKNRLQHVLKLLVKVCMSKPIVSKELGDRYKACYKATFRLSDELDSDRLLEGLHKSLIEIEALINGTKNK